MIDPDGLPRAVCDARLAFAQAHGLGALAPGTVRRLLCSLPDEPEHVIDLANKGGRAFLAVFLGSMKNTLDACELVPIAVRGTPAQRRALLEQAIAMAEGFTRLSTGRDALTLTTDAELACARDLLHRSGYRPLGFTCILERPLVPDDERPSAAAWRRVTDARVEDYWRITQAAFAGQSDVAFPDFVRFRAGVLASDPPPELLFGDAEPVAFVKVVKGSAPGSAVIDLIGRHPSHRGQRMGDRALRQGLSLARAQGANTVSVTVGADNSSALALYERHGFREIDRQVTWFKRLDRSRPVPTRRPPLGSRETRPRSGRPRRS